MGLPSAVVHLGVPSPPRCRARQHADKLARGSPPRTHRGWRGGHPQRKRGDARAQPAPVPTGLRRRSAVEHVTHTCRYASGPRDRSRPRSQGRGPRSPCHPLHAGWRGAPHPRRIVQAHRRARSPAPHRRCAAQHGHRIPPRSRVASGRLACPLPGGPGAGLAGRGAARPRLPQPVLVEGAGRFGGRRPDRDHLPRLLAAGRGGAALPVPRSRRFPGRGHGPRRDGPRSRRSLGSDGAPGSARSLVRLHGARTGRSRELVPRDPSRPHLRPVCAGERRRTGEVPGLAWRSTADLRGGRSPGHGGRGGLRGARAGLHRPASRGRRRNGHLPRHGPTGSGEPARSGRRPGLPRGPGRERGPPDARAGIPALPRRRVAGRLCR